MRIGPFIIQIVYELSEKSHKLAGFSIRFAWLPSEARSQHNSWAKWKATQEALRKKK